jgi:hypothetical protein
MMIYSLMVYLWTLVTPMLHKQYGKKYLIVCYYIQYCSANTNFWKSHLVNSKDSLILVYCLPFGKARGLQILRCQGIEVNNYNFTLDALTLKPSGFCNVRGNTR